MLENYLKIAYKVLLRRKFFTFVSLFGISFTLVVLMVVAAMVDHILSPLDPETNLSRTLHVSNMSMRGERSEWSGSPGYLFLDKYCRDLPNVENMSIFSEASSEVSFVDGKKIVSEMRRTDGQYWEVLDFEFVEGSPYVQADVDQGRSVAVISRSTRSSFFGEGQALGETIEIDGQSFTVLGVVEDVPRIRFTAYGGVWVPITTAKTDGYRDRLMGTFNAILVARSRADFGAIRTEFQSRLPHVEMTDPQRYDRLEGHPRTRFEDVAAETAGTDKNDKANARQFLVTFFGAALLFMLLPAINLVNINMSRIIERSSEIGVRKAFGASSAHLVGQFIVENVFLCLVGGLLGLLGSAYVLWLINGSGWIPNAEFGVNYRVFLYALGLATFFGLLSGAYPAWRMSRLDPVNALRGGPR